MSRERNEQLAETLAADDDQYVLHRVAQQVVYSAGLHPQGWDGWSRIDGMELDHVETIREYIGSFIGDTFPLLYKNDEGTVKKGGFSRIDRADIRFTAGSSYVDDDGISHVWLRW